MLEKFPIITCFIVIISMYVSPSMSRHHSPERQNVPIQNGLRVDPEAIEFAPSDFGNIVLEAPTAVLDPSSITDIASLIKSSYSNSTCFNIAARGVSHSVHGQALARNGVVVNMTSLENQINGSGIAISKSASLGFYADVGGEQLWIDVLHAAVEQGLTPVSWTDYLYLTVGGTLSNAGISGQAFRYGPQISNVYEMDVITGNGDLVTCSSQNNSNLFYAVLGGLGQFGIITRARIALEPTPQRTTLVHVLYSDFDAFSRDQESLISINGRDQQDALDYMEGFVLMNQGSLSSSDDWRLSFFPPEDHPRIISLITHYGIIYCIELAKHYDNSTAKSVEEAIQVLLKKLSSVPGYIFEKDISYVDFIARVENEDQQKLAHPWLNLFVPKSRISDFNTGVFGDIVMKRNITTSLVLLYPMNRTKWDDKMSAVVTDEEIFYTVGFLHSSGLDEWEPLDAQNKDILQFCDNVGIKLKQYLPNYETKEAWQNHFGMKWRTFLEAKTQFDPKRILSPGQRIFNNN